jgi:hypothetical protein
MTDTIIVRGPIVDHRCHATIILNLLLMMTTVPTALTAGIFNVSRLFLLTYRRPFRKLLLFVYYQ